MASFDGYQAWLGISEMEQPPNHYRLLGIEDFESDASAIDVAAANRFQQIEKNATTEQAEMAEKISQEIEQARRVLLDPTEKRAYDGQLKKKRDANSADTFTASPPGRSEAPAWFLPVIAFEVVIECILLIFLVAGLTGG